MAGRDAEHNQCERKQARHIHSPSSRRQTRVARRQLAWEKNVPSAARLQAPPTLVEFARAVGMSSCVLRYRRTKFLLNESRGPEQYQSTDSSIAARILGWIRSG
jgi:hypothetical protein